MESLDECQSPETPERPSPGSSAAAHVARLAIELRRMSSHRDDATAIAALDLLEQVQAAGPAVTAQQFESIYRAAFRAQWRSLGTPTRAEWKAVHRLAVEAFQALLREWRDRARSRAPVAAWPCDAATVTIPTSTGVVP